MGKVWTGEGAEDVADDSAAGVGAAGVDVRQEADHSVGVKDTICPPRISAVALFAIRIPLSA